MLGRVTLGLLWALSLVGVALLTHRGPTEVPPAVVVQSPVVPVVRLPASSGLTLEELRAVIREELAAERAPVAVAPPPDPVRQERARAAVHGALDAGRWTNDRRNELRAQLGTLSREEVDEVLGELFVAINEGRIKVEVDGPVL